MLKRKAILRPLALAFVLASGFAIVFSILVGWLVSVWEEWYGKSYVTEFTEVREGGQPLIRRTVVDRGRRHDSYLTLDRVEAHPSNDRPTGAALMVPHEREFGEFPLSAWSRVRFFSGDLREDSWYFVHDGLRDGHGYFVGFNTDTKLRVGFIGRRGFSAERPAQDDFFAVAGVGLVDRLSSPEEFFPSGWSYSGYGNPSTGDFPLEKIYVIAGNQLLQVDLGKRSVTTIIDSAELIALGVLEPVRPAKAPRETADGVIHHALMAVRTVDRILLFDAAGKQKIAYMIPADFREKSFTFYDLDDGTALFSIEGGEFVWIDVTGNVLTRKKVTLENSLQNDFPWQSALFAPAPLMVGAAIAIHAADQVFQGESPSYASALKGTLLQAWTALMAVSVLGALLAYVCHRRQRKYAQAWTGAWIVFVFLLGLPGLVGYLFYRRWPVREACPACQQLVPRDREACAACGAEFPPPKPKGIEVFA
jgi:hypothetical protein